jgi:hypothetical protein
MKLTNRQLKSVTDLLVKEENEKKHIQMNAFKNKKNSFINESFLFEDVTALENIPEQMFQNIDNFSTNYSQTHLDKVRTPVYKLLANLLQKVTGESMDMNVLKEELEAFDVYEYEMQLATDIKAAIDNYADAIAKAAITMVGDSSGE